MKIVIDAQFDVHGVQIGEQFIDTSDPVLPQQHGAPIGTQYASWVLFLTHMNTVAADRLAGGWGVVNQLPGEAAPMTRWARLVAAANAATADPTIKAIGLSGV